MTVKAGYFASTSFSDTVSASSASMQADPDVMEKRFDVLVTSDTDLHLRRTDGNAVAAVAATADDMFVPAKTPFLVCLFAGDWLSWVRDSADGNIFITGVTQ